jgi:hypothetical protein
VQAISATPMPVSHGPPVHHHVVFLDWDSVVLDPSVVQLVRNDFESFFRREHWFQEHGLPFRRGYLFHSPPGNGKTTVIKVMTSHPAITPLTFDFGSECMNNESLSGFFEEGARAAHHRSYSKTWTELSWSGMTESSVQE